jgi:hypothetical protein
MISVRVGALPQTPIREVTLDEGATVRDALSAAGISLDGREVRVGGAPAGLDDEVSNGDSVLVTAQVKGNRLVRWARGLIRAFLRR